MDRVKERFNVLRSEAEAASERADIAERKLKNLEHEFTAKEQEIASYQHQLGLLQGKLDDAEVELRKAQAALEEDARNKEEILHLQRTVQTLNSEVDAAELARQDIMQKFQQVDIKAEHFEKQVQKLEQERDAMEKKYESEAAKSKAAQKELDDLVLSMGDI